MHVLSTETVGLTHVRVPLNEPFVISSGAVTHKDAILIEFLAEGLVGYGEASPMGGSFDSRHTPESSWQSLTDHVLPRLAGRDALNPLDPALLGDLDDPYVAAAFDAALWDLVAKAQGLPLWARLGGDGEKPVESGLAVGITNTIDELLNLIAGYLAQGGYRRVKIKVQPGWDVEPLEAVRERFGDIPLMVDANCAYGPDNLDALSQWGRFELTMIEQPFGRDDLESHAALADRIRTPICLDESADAVETVKRAIDCGAGCLRDGSSGRSIQSRMIPRSRRMPVQAVTVMMPVRALTVQVRLVVQALVKQSRMRHLNPTHRLNRRMHQTHPIKRPMQNASLIRVHVSQLAVIHRPMPAASIQQPVNPSSRRPSRKRWPRLYQRLSPSRSIGLTPGSSMPFTPSSRPTAKLSSSYSRPAWMRSGVCVAG